MIAQNESQVDLNVYNNNIGLAGGVAYPADSKPEHMAVEEIVLSNRSSIETLTVHLRTSILDRQTNSTLSFGIVAWRYVVPSPCVSK